MIVGALTLCELPTGPKYVTLLAGKLTISTNLVPKRNASGAVAERTNWGFPAVGTSVGPR